MNNLTSCKLVDLIEIPEDNGGMNKEMTLLTDLSQIEELQYSSEYAEFIMDNAGGERPICNGDMLLDLQEEGYLFEEFLASQGLYLD